MMKNHQAFRGVTRLVFLQIAVVLALAGLFFISSDRAAWSALVGGLVCILPGVYFAWRVFKYSGARAAQKVVRAFYAGEAVKLLLTMLMFTIVFIYLPIAPGAFFGGFIGAQCVYWVAPWLFSRACKEKR